MSFFQHIWVFRERYYWSGRKLGAQRFVGRVELSQWHPCIFFFREKLKKFQVRDMVWVEERKKRSHSESFESLWLQDRVVPVPPCCSLFSSLNRSVWANRSMINTSIARSPQWSADLYLQKNSCHNESSVLWSCTPSNPSVRYRGWWIAGCAGEIRSAKTVCSFFCRGRDAKR